MKSIVTTDDYASDATHRSLLSRLKDWDDNLSWKKFFDTYWKLIYSTAIKAGLTPEEAQDVVQETVVSVAKRMRDFKYDPALGSFKGWLRTLARCRIVDHWRKQRRALPVGNPPAAETTRTATIDRVPDPESLNLDAVWDEDWQKNLLDAAKERVKQVVGPKQYQVFDLYAVKGWTVAEVTKALGVSAFQVYQAKTRVTRAIKKEVQNLEREMI